LLLVGSMKLARPSTVLAGNGMAWVEDFSAPSIKLSGALEIVGAVGLIAPLVTGIAPILVVFAAVGLAVIMIGAALVHLRRKESAIPAITLAVLCVVSATLGFIVL
jgi:hypothetical protein